MAEPSYLASNIRSLRKAYGETQESLGNVLHVEKNTISNYENGTRTPDRAMLSSIARYFSVSEEELLYSDLSGIGEVRIDYAGFLDALDRILPVIGSEAALQDPLFKKAYTTHRAVYKEVRACCFDHVDRLSDCIEGYLAVCAEECGARPYAAACFLSVWYFLMLFFKGLRDYEGPGNAALMQAVRNDPVIREDWEKTRSGKKTLPDAFPAMAGEDGKLLQTELLKELKRSEDLQELCDYYIALGYVFNGVDNDLSAEMNNRIGGEMLRAFASVGNRYAARSLRILRRMLAKAEE